jgi:hypothetical protein
LDITFGIDIIGKTLEPSASLKRISEKLYELAFATAEPDLIKGNFCKGHLANIIAKAKASLAGIEAMDNGYLR